MEEEDKEEEEEEQEKRGGSWRGDKKPNFCEGIRAG